MIMASFLSASFNDKNYQERLFLTGPGNDLDWTIVRPSGLTNGKLTDKTQILKGEATTISRADVAKFCIDSIFENKYITECPSIGY